MQGDGGRGATGSRGLRLLPGLVLPATLLLGSGAFSQMQEPVPFPVPPSSQAGGRVPFGSEPNGNSDPAMRHAILEAARKRNIERQQRIVADTEKIVRLAQELSAAGAPADLMAKKSEEIEKLARGVRERMRTE